MDDLLSDFQHTLQRLGLSGKDRLLLAVSGGLDSIVLTACVARTEYDFGIAHANFQLRGAESDRDEDFVRQLALRYNKPFFVNRFNTEKYASDEKLSTQVAARNLRYEWFNSLTGNQPDQFQFILTAHHLNDNLETMLMHFFRGTGISGLTGMPEKNERLIRPFLKIRKNRLKDFAEAEKLAWIEDSSNMTDDYTRNYFRNRLIPSLESIFPELEKNLEKNLQRFSDAASLYEQAILVHKKKLLKTNGAEMQIPILLLKKSKPVRTILFELIRDYHFTPAQTDEVFRLMDSSNGKYVSSSTHRIIKNRRWLIIAPRQVPGPSHLIIEEGQEEMIYPGGILHLKIAQKHDPDSFSKEPGTACLDAGKIQFPLMLRKWQTGDYFYPLGMHKKKKLSRFFIDQKLSKTAKEKTWVLVMDNQIIWVVGYRIDNRFCLRPSTSTVLEIRNEPAPASAD
jgi:tRNA(Ile)-lysidine synthase